MYLVVYVLEIDCFIVVMMIVDDCGVVMLIVLDGCCMVMFDCLFVLVCELGIGVVGIYVYVLICDGWLLMFVLVLVNMVVSGV